MYNVTAFVAKDSLPTADTLRWKRVLFVYDNAMVVYNMKDKQDWYHYDVDSIKNTLTLHKLDSKTITNTLQYTYPSKGTMQINGKWKGKDISVSLKLSPVDSMHLNKEKLKILGIRKESRRLSNARSFKSRNIIFRYHAPVVSAVAFSYPAVHFGGYGWYYGQ